MWKQLENVIRYIPKYLWLFGRCFSSPQGFVGELYPSRQDATREEHKFLQFQDSLIFMATSVLLAVLLETPFFDRVEFWTQVVRSCILSLVGVVMAALALRCSWSCVGGKTGFVKYFVIDAYVAGVGIALLGGVFLLQDGVNQIFEIKDGHIMFWSIRLAGLFFVGIWALIFWEAYRLLNSLSNTRAFFALLIFHVLNIPTLVILVILEGAN